MLSELAGNGWTMAEPPLERDGESVVARVEGQPIKAGFLTERIKDSKDEFHVKYRTGQYDLEVKVDFASARGQIRVEEADGYDHTEE